MESKRKEKKSIKKQPKTNDHVICDMCGNTLKPVDFSWQEDEEGRIFCPDCRAENESCGCSD